MVSLSNCIFSVISAGKKGGNKASKIRSKLYHTFMSLASKTEHCKGRLPYDWPNTDTTLLYTWKSSKAASTFMSFAWWPSYISACIHSIKQKHVPHSWRKKSRVSAFPKRERARPVVQICQWPWCDPMPCRQTSEVKARWAYVCVCACVSVCWRLHVVTMAWSHKEQSCTLPDP